MIRDFYQSFEVHNMLEGLGIQFWLCLLKQNKQKKKPIVTVSQQTSINYR
jgi:hypothetical protein